MAPLLWRIMAVDKTLTGHFSKSEKQSNDSHYEKTSAEKKELKKRRIET